MPHPFIKRKIRTIVLFFLKKNNTKTAILGTFNQEIFYFLQKFATKWKIFVKQNLIF